jgi:cyclophilin family peptidyl-prolyl cis-trans isomerase
LIFNKKSLKKEESIQNSKEEPLSLLKQTENPQPTNGLNNPAKPQLAKETTQSTNKKSGAPAMQLRQDVDYKALIKTNKGDFTVDLFEKEAPITVNNFVYLSKMGFYDGLKFHRIIQDFMIQGGDPKGNGTGGPGYSFQDEINEKKLVRGSLAMANAGPNTNGSQFFIVTAENTPWLDKKHTNFGQVIENYNVVEEISKVSKDQNDKPLIDVVIKTILIQEN